METSKHNYGHNHSHLDTHLVSFKPNICGGLDSRLHFWANICRSLAQLLINKEHSNHNKSK